MNDHDSSRTRGLDTSGIYQMWGRFWAVDKLDSYRNA